MAPKTILVVQTVQPSWDPRAPTRVTAEALVAEFEYLGAKGCPDDRRPNRGTFVASKVCCSRELEAARRAIEGDVRVVQLLRHATTDPRMQGADEFVLGDAETLDIEKWAAACLKSWKWRKSTKRGVFRYDFACPVTVFERDTSSSDECDSDSGDDLDRMPWLWAEVMDSFNGAELEQYVRLGDGTTDARSVRLVYSATHAGLVVRVEYTRPLGDSEIDALAGELSGQFTDGWGETLLEIEQKYTVSFGSDVRSVRRD